MALSIDFSFVRSRKVVALAEYWRMKCNGGTWPTRGDLAPTDLKELLPNIVLSEVTRSPLQVYYRLVGTRVAEMSRLDFTGRWLHDMNPASVDPGIWHKGYEMLLETGQPVFGRTGIPIAEGSEIMLEEEFGLFPLELGVSDRFQCVAVEDYGDAQHIDPEILRAMQPR
ncbi:PAS domain-containing protein [Pacificispira sp.]|uniref:PAS domain-containing protein n=1 Tax=Pacificispira sp. TaxID=2888761 RepID=UPI003BAB0D55